MTVVDGVPAPSPDRPGTRWVDEHTDPPGDIGHGRHHGCRRRRGRGAFQVALDSVGLTARDLRGDPDDYVRRTMGQSKITVFTELLRGDRHRAEQANRAFETAFDQAVDRDEVAAMPGAEACLAALRDAGMRLCLTTGFSPATRDRVIAALGWEAAVDLVLSPTDAGRGRPWPDMILTAVLRLRIDDVAEVAVVGDTASDLLSGARSGASMIVGVLSGVHSPAELTAAPTPTSSTRSPTCPSCSSARRETRRRD